MSEKSRRESQIFDTAMQGGRENLPSEPDTVDEIYDERYKIEDAYEDRKVDLANALENNHDPADIKKAIEYYTEAEARKEDFDKMWAAYGGDAIAQAQQEVFATQSDTTSTRHKRAMDKLQAAEDAFHTRLEEARSGIYEDAYAADAEFNQNKSDSEKNTTTPDDSPDDGEDVEDTPHAKRFAELTSLIEEENSKNPPDPRRLAMLAQQMSDLMRTPDEDAARKILEDNPEPAAGTLPNPDSDAEEAARQALLADSEPAKGTVQAVESDAEKAAREALLADPTPAGPVDADKTQELPIVPTKEKEAKKGKWLQRVFYGAGAFFTRAVTRGYERFSKMSRRNRVLTGLAVAAGLGGAIYGGIELFSGSDHAGHAKDVIDSAAPGDAASGFHGGGRPAPELIDAVPTPDIDAFTGGMEIKSGDGFLKVLDHIGIPKDAQYDVLDKILKSDDPTIKPWVYGQDGLPRITHTGNMGSDVLQSIRNLL